MPTVNLCVHCTKSAKRGTYVHARHGTRTCFEVQRTVDLNYREFGIYSRSSTEALRALRIAKEEIPLHNREFQHHPRLTAQHHMRPLSGCTYTDRNSLFVIPEEQYAHFDIKEDCTDCEQLRSAFLDNSMGIEMTVHTTSMGHYCTHDYNENFEATWSSLQPRDFEDECFDISTYRSKYQSAILKLTVVPLVLGTDTRDESFVEVLKNDRDVSEMFGKRTLQISRKLLQERRSRLERETPGAIAEDESSKLLCELEDDQYDQEVLAGEWDEIIMSLPFERLIPIEIIRHGQISTQGEVLNPEAYRRQDETVVDIAPLRGLFQLPLIDMEDKFPDFFNQDNYIGVQNEFLSELAHMESINYLMAE